MPYGKKWGWGEEEINEFVRDLRGTTITVNIAFEGKQKVMSSGEVERLLRKARTIALTDCECRTKVNACSAPRDVCLYLDKGAEEHIKRGMGKKVEFEEAMAALKRSSGAGLVLIALSDKTVEGSGPHYICSCCSCCCHAMATLQQYGFNEAIIASDAVAEQNNSACTDCGDCVDRCHFKARTMVEGKLAYDPKKCFGCGLCVGECEVGAISLASRH